MAPLINEPATLPATPPNPDPRHRFHDERDILHPADGLPEGQTYHAAGSTGDGWIVIALWDSQESYERFRDETLLPGFESLGDQGLPGPPQETTFEIHREEQG